MDVIPFELFIEFTDQAQNLASSGWVGSWPKVPARHNNGMLVGQASSQPKHGRVPIDEPASRSRESP